MLLQGQRAGPAGSNKDRYPQVWKWKKESFTDACRTLRDTLLSQDPDSSTQQDVSFAKWPGLFEAGNAVIITGISAFATSQMVLGALHFWDVFTSHPDALLPDAAGCLPREYSRYCTNHHIRQTLQCALHLPIRQGVAPCFQMC
jgi:hypothetical protein